MISDYTQLHGSREFHLCEVEQEGRQMKYNVSCIESIHEYTPIDAMFMDMCFWCLMIDVMFMGICFWCLMIDVMFIGCHGVDETMKDVDKIVFVRPGSFIRTLRGAG